MRSARIGRNCISAEASLESKERKFRGFITKCTSIFFVLFSVLMLHASISEAMVLPLQTVEEESFEHGNYALSKFIANSGTITHEPQKVVSGAYSAYLESPSTVPYAEFNYSNPDKIRFERNTTYTVTFSYKSIVAPTAAKNGSFYFLVRGTDNDTSADTGWTTWTDPAGTQGTKTITFTTGNKSNYYLIWGICNGGAISIDDINIQKASESYESGSYNSTFFLPNSGTITHEPQKVVSGAYSAYLESPSTVPYAEFNYSNPDKIRFERNTTYTVTFSYKSIVAPTAAKNGSFYFLVRGTDNDTSADTGWTTWTDPAGAKKIKTITFTTGNKSNYYLIWGICNGGAISIDDINIQKASESYESGSYNSTFFLPNSGTITHEPQKVVSGAYSAYLESPSTVPFAEFNYSNPDKIRFERNTTYTVTFSYKSIVAPTAAKNGSFYFLVRGTDNDTSADTGWTTWTDPAGAKKIKTITFTTGNKSNYYLIWGICNGGAISIDDIRIKEDEYQYDTNGRLVKRNLPNLRYIRYTYDGNGNLLSSKVE